MYEGIVSKINNHDFVFDANEILVIKNSEDLYTKLFNYIVENNVIMNRDLFDLYDAFINDEIIPIDERHVYVYACSALENCLLRYSDLGEVMVYLQSEEEIADLKKRFLNLYCDTQRLNELKLREEDLVWLLDNKLYDKIASYNSSIYIEDNIGIIQRVKEEFPFDKYGFPRAFFRFKDDLREQFSNCSFKTIIEALSESFINDCNDQYYCDLVYRKIMDDKELDGLDEDSIGGLQMLLVYFIPFEKNNEVSEQLLKHDIFLLMFHTNEYNNNKKEFISYVLDRVKNSKIAKASTAKFFEIAFTSYFDGVKSVFDELIQQGEYEFISCLDNKSDVKTTCINELIEEIKKDKSKFNFEFVPAFFGNHLDLFETIVEYLGETIKTVSLNVSDSNVIDVPVDEKFKAKKAGILIKLLDKNPKVSFQYDAFNDIYDKRLLSKIIDIKNKDLLKDYIRNCSSFSAISSQFEKDCLELAIQDDFFALVYFDSTYSQHIFSYLFDDENALKAIFNKSYYISKKIISYINHNEDSVKYTDKIYNIIKDTICREYNIDVNKLDYVVSIVGPEIVRYVENDNIIQLLNLGIDEISKICELFKTEEYDIRDLEGAFDSLIQYKFSGDNLDVVRTFTNILHSIEDGNDDYIDIIDKMVPYLDANFYLKFGNKYDLPERVIIDPEYLLNLVVEKIKLGDEKSEKYKTVLREIVSYYINCKREEYRAKFDMYSEMQIPFELEDNFKKNYLSVYYYISNPVFKIDENSGNYVSFMNLVDEKLVSKGISRELIPYIYQYVLMTSQSLYPNGMIPASKEIPEDILENVKSEIGVFKNTCKEVYADYEEQIDSACKYQIDFLVERGDKENLIRKKYKFGLDTDLANVLKSVRVDILKEKILSNQDVYNRLYDFIHKKKIFDLPQCLKDYIEENSIDIKYDDTYVLAFINYFYSIDEKLRKIAISNGNDPDKINYNLPLMLKEGRSYGGVSGVYSFILGEEDAHLIMSNPNPNAAISKTTNNQRLDEALELTVKNYLRNDITVPTFNEILEKNGKSMRCVLGNFTAPENLTLGERTGACMRIGGVGESLFNFALGNENGFHIIFKNPKTGEFVSRVTGFRNGNTVFLNQLRYSCDNTYSDEDVIEFCKIAANKLIDYSKGSTLSIDNVVISSGYAMIDYRTNMVDLGVPNIKKGLPVFYSDVSERAIVLATSAKEKDFVPLDFDKSNIPHYQPCRRDVIDYINKNFVETINRVHNIKKFMEEKNVENLEHIDITDGIVMGYANDDWYIYSDVNGNIYEEIIDGDLRAEVELENARNLIQEKMNKVGYHI